ncbi:hypothetical protein [Streptomyces sp. NPDC004629]|uniref:hypothetical protein n=1 Tax=Streptomyces sp. NPDC004629 TaxID=3364705 RepID=UPI003675D577
MSSARMILATAVASAAIAITAPVAHASGGDEGGRGDSSYNKENGNDSRRDEPRGGLHTGGGALTALPGRGDEDRGEDRGENKGEDRGEDRGGEPRGGVHAGGGALTSVDARGDGQEDRPRGGVHTGGGALTALPARGDEDRGENKGEDRGEDRGGEPRGGVHTGGGALSALPGRDDDNRRDEPRGGVHTGGGALTALTARGDEHRGENKGEDRGEDRGGEPRGGVHTGGGALAAAKAHGDRGGEPRGGVHTGGGALTAAVNDSWNADSGDTSRFDPETYRDNSGKGNDKEKGADGERNKDSWSGGDREDRPRGGVHTGGGALATSGVTAGGLAVVAFLGACLYALRRKHADGSVF